MLEFIEAAKGVEKEISVRRYEGCDACGGTGAASKDAVGTCSLCGGTGQVSQTGGFFSITRTCHECQGAGRVIKDPCRICSGTGRREEKRKITVNCVSPGFIATDLIEDLPDDQKKEYRKMVPLKRFGSPDDVAHAVLFLSYK